ncbi:DUF45 domain-containing protein [Candidatus Micrarchaeota archaeon]|nr:DUF45 domain-containing protein [Candidatus Micrarchaeota archaeon]
MNAYSMSSNRSFLRVARIKGVLYSNDLKILPEIPNVQEIEINGRLYRIETVMTRNRNAYARLKGETILVSMPGHWPRKEREKTAASLVKRTVKEIARGRWTPEGSRKLEFSHGQMLSILGQEYNLVFIPSGRFGGKTRGSTIEIRVAEHPEKEKKASQMVCSQIIKAAKPEVMERVRHFNTRHFNTDIKRLTLRDNTSTWGSCSKKGNITLNIRLLFMPLEILDYVIVHELAHTRYMSHGSRFWGLVERVLPDYRERKKWLRNYGWSAVPGKRSGQQKISSFFHECPL